MMDHGHRFALYSRTGVVVGIWKDIRIAMDSQQNHPQSKIVEMVLAEKLVKERNLSDKLAETLKKSARSTDSDSVFYERMEALADHKEARRA